MAVTVASEAVAGNAADTVEEMAVVVGIPVVASHSGAVLATTEATTKVATTTFASRSCCLDPENWLETTSSVSGMKRCECKCGRFIGYRPG